MKRKQVFRLNRSYSLLALCAVLTFGAGAWTTNARAGMDPFIGEIIMFGGNFAPRGWALCEGQLLPLNQNQALFAILGTTYGGDGRTTFGLPDLRGRVPMGNGNGPGLTSRGLGQKSGAENVTLTTAQIPSHTHTASTTSTLKATSNSGNTNAPAGNVLANDGNDRIYRNEAPNVDMSTAAIDSSTTLGNTGNGQAVNNMQPYQVVNFIIAVTGIFPSRN